MAQWLLLYQATQSTSDILLVSVLFNIFNLSWLTNKIIISLSLCVLQEGFTNEVSFQNHICHEVEKPHSCSVCSKRFQRIQQLRRHARAAHGRHHEEPQVGLLHIHVYWITLRWLVFSDTQVFPVWESIWKVYRSWKTYTSCPLEGMIFQIFLLRICCSLFEMSTSFVFDIWRVATLWTGIFCLGKTTQMYYLLQKFWFARKLEQARSSSPFVRKATPMHWMRKEIRSCGCAKATSKVMFACLPSLEYYWYFLFIYRDIHFYDKKTSVKQRLAAIQMKKARVIIQNIAAENANSQVFNRHGEIWFSISLWGT